jgi:hypothetical protein
MSDRAYWVLLVITLCIVVYLNASCSPEIAHFNRKPLACYF